jgi:sterol 14-demethylase
MRWAKLQQNIILAYALAQFKWSSCDANGEPMLREAHRKQLDDPHATSFTKYYVKYVPRE